MAYHEFGIMQQAPEQETRYDTYEPQRYHCIRVSDDALAAIVKDLDWLETYWHTRAVPKSGLCYCGITLIPPSSLPTFIAHLPDTPAFSALKALVTTALEDHRWVIHFGL